MSWTTMRLKHVARVGYGLGQPPELSDTGIPILRATNINRGKFSSRGLIFATKSDLPLERAPLLGEGEILVVRSGAYTGDSALVTREWVGSAPGYDLRVSPMAAYSPFIAYCLLGATTLDQIDLAKSRAAQPHLNADDLGDVRIPLPDVVEQRRIADFLDAAIAKVDALAAHRRSQSAALGEVELSQIGEHLGGFDATGSRIGTGWGWLPSLPSGWGVGPVYAYFHVELGKMLNAARASSESRLPYLRNANVHWYEVGTEDMASMAFDEDERIRYGVRAGDLLVCEGGAGVAEAAVWDGRFSPCFYQKSLHRVRATKDLPVEWLMYWLRYAKAAGVFEADGNLATIPHLTGEQLAEYRIPIPPDSRRRVAELKSLVASIRNAQAALDAANALLAERRQALITAAVTGQIDVTTAGGVAA
ncbi:restriction endonuclease subunit S [Pseudonocardia sp. MH-G8]|uniref:restriction endonuclease subunit S n=1 Tax=Pseudonocardia sp. MH-G8 TaxID=1854588 RepID=UPI000BA07A5D|nr:restriction endonuclease subunit S [Pseudonocardia sp. MH-G8]OZM75641.1 hypothetical protein CFP66_45420 [Pseudonocardia sp. MH-G8]